MITTTVGRRALLGATGLVLAATTALSGSATALADTRNPPVRTIASATPTTLPPLNSQALQAAIDGLPTTAATAALVKVTDKNGKWSGVSGVADIRTNRPASANVRFRVGSVTKVVTAAAVLQLAAEGRIGLDQTVQQHLPGLLPADYPPITVGQLLNHTSGLPAPTTPGNFDYLYEHRFETMTPRQYVAEAVKHPVEFVPGTRQHYLNTGYVVAGLLIEKVTGQSYERAVTARILCPQGMRDSYFPGNSPRIHGSHNRGYQIPPEGSTIPVEKTMLLETASGSVRVVDVTEFDQTSTWAAGAMISTTADLDRFVNALFAGEVVPPAQLENMFTTPDVTVFDPRNPGDPTPKAADHSMGMSKRDLGGGLVAWGKSGARYGFSAGIGGVRDAAGGASRTLVYSINSTDAKAEGSNELADRIAFAAMK